MHADGSDTSVHGEKMRMVFTVQQNDESFSGMNCNDAGGESANNVENEHRVSVYEYDGHVSGDAGGQFIDSWYPEDWLIAWMQTGVVLGNVPRATKTKKI